MKNAIPAHATIANVVPTPMPAALLPLEVSESFDPEPSTNGESVGTGLETTSGVGVILGGFAKSGASVGTKNDGLFEGDLEVGAFTTVGERVFWSVGTVVAEIVVGLEVGLGVSLGKEGAEVSSYSHGGNSYSYSYSYSPPPQVHGDHVGL